MVVVPHWAHGVYARRERMGCERATSRLRFATLDVNGATSRLRFATLDVNGAASRLRFATLDVNGVTAGR